MSSFCLRSQQENPASDYFYTLEKGLWNRKKKQFEDFFFKSSDYFVGFIELLCGAVYLTIFQEDSFRAYWQEDENFSSKFKNLLSHKLRM